MWHQLLQEVNHSRNYYTKDRDCTGIAQILMKGTRDEDDISVKPHITMATMAEV